MAVDLHLLVPEFSDKVNTLINNCLEKGVIMKPSEGLRDPFVQAKYWRRSRSGSEVAAKIKELNQEGADFLAYCFTSVGPQPDGPWATNAIPGYSWHQWAEAIDCLWYVDGKPVGNAEAIINGLKGYEIYALEAKAIGLESGYFWKAKDSGHVQLRSAPAPADIYSLADINSIMKQRFGNNYVV
jgi:hypothetical protein